MDRLESQETRRLLLSIITDAATLVVGVADFGSDIASLSTIYLHKSEYSDGLLIAYSTATAMAAFVSSAPLMVLLNSILFDAAQVRTGKLLMLSSNDALTKGINIGKCKRFDLKNKIAPDTDIKDDIAECSDEASDRLDSVENITEKESSKLRFKDHVIEKEIRGSSANIMVGLLEDIPFYVLNMIAVTKTSGNQNIVLLFSMTLGSISFGWKLCVFKNLFKVLSAKTEIKERMVMMQKIDRTFRISRINSQNQMVSIL